jgi:hypothetical protein
MNIQALQVFMDGNSIPGVSVPVDLLKVARNIQKQRTRNSKGQPQPPSNAKLRLVLDGECCLDRLYGGYFSGMSFILRLQ